MSGIMYRIDGNPCSQAAALDFLERIGGIDPADVADILARCAGDEDARETAGMLADERLEWCSSPA